MIHDYENQSEVLEESLHCHNQEEINAALRCISLTSKSDEAKLNPANGKYELLKNKNNQTSILVTTSWTKWGSSGSAKTKLKK